jgi:hypothetical protein
MKQALMYTIFAGLGVLAVVVGYAAFRYYTGT